MVLITRRGSLTRVVLGCIIITERDSNRALRQSGVIGVEKQTVTEIEKIIVAVLKANDVKRAALFGSFVRAENNEDSDIDVVVEFNGRKSLLDLAGLKIDLEDDLGRDVDVVTYDSLHPLLRDRILNEQKVIL